MVLFCREGKTNGQGGEMIMVLVQCHVRRDQIEGFRRASMENAFYSLQEPGIFRFDILQDADDPTRFILAEGYRDDTAPAFHKGTNHYQKWRDTVAGMMEENRSSRKYEWLAPGNPKSSQP
jgi:autoinducer 2-degrading protein